MWHSENTSLWTFNRLCQRLLSTQCIACCKFLQIIDFRAKFCTNSLQIPLNQNLTNANSRAQCNHQRWIISWSIRISLPDKSIDTNANSYSKPNQQSGSSLIKNERNCIVGTFEFWLCHRKRVFGNCKYRRSFLQINWTEQIGKKLLLNQAFPATFCSFRGFKIVNKNSKTEAMQNWPWWNYHHLYVYYFFTYKSLRTKVQDVNFADSIIQWTQLSWLKINKKTFWRSFI